MKRGQCNLNQNQINKKPQIVNQERIEIKN